MEKTLGKDLDEMDFRLYKSMGEWHNRIADILAYINDVLCIPLVGQSAVESSADIPLSIGRVRDPRGEKAMAFL